MPAPHPRIDSLETHGSSVRLAAATLRCLALFEPDGETVTQAVPRAMRPRELSPKAWPQALFSGIDYTVPIASVPAAPSTGAL
jgi:hypothetical protein